MLSPGTWSGRERSSHTGQQQCRGQGSPFSFFLRLRCGGRVRAWFKANRAFLSPRLRLPLECSCMSQAPSSGRGRIFLSQELLSLMSLEIRPVREEDVEVVCGLIHALARYERLESHCKATSEQLREELFGPRAVIGCVLAWEVNEATGAERPWLRALLLQLLHLPHEARPLP